MLKRKQDYQIKEAKFIRQVKVMRLFIALNFSPHLKHTIGLLLKELQDLPIDCKWVEPENLHLTLKFIGEVEGNLIHDLVQVLERLADDFEPWEVEIKGSGVFPHWRRPRVVWLGVQAPPGLFLFQKTLAQELEKLPLSLDQKPFVPHITLGRLRLERNVELLQKKIQPLAEEVWGTEVIKSVELMESRLTPEGALYSVRSSIPLRGKTGPEP